MSNLVTRMEKLRDRLTRIPVRFGIPQYRQVVLRKRELINLIPNIYYLVIEPMPKVTNVNPNYVGHRVANNVEIAHDDLSIEGVSRQYTYEQLTENVDAWLIDAVQSGSEWTGTVCHPLHVSDRSLLTWDVTLRIFVDNE